MAGGKLWAKGLTSTWKTLYAESKIAPPGAHMSDEHKKTSQVEIEPRRFLPLDEANRVWETAQSEKRKHWELSHPRLASLRDASISLLFSAAMFWVATSASDREWISIGATFAAVVLGLRCLFYFILLVWNPAPAKRDDAAANIILALIGAFVFGLILIQYINAPPVSGFRSTAAAALFGFVAGYAVRAKLK